MKILMAGDTHGNHRHVQWLLDTCDRYGIKVILQVGDFGFLWRDPGALKGLSKMLEKHGVEMWWIDGNHENFSMMTERGIDIMGDDFWIKPNIRYLPRGFRFEVEGCKFMSFGGAVSVDREFDHRTPGVSWFDQETIKPHQVDAVSDEPVDVFVSHDAPLNLPVLDAFLAKPNPWPEQALRDSEWNRTLLTEVIDKVTPKIIVHGHYHYRYDDVYNNSAQVIGLNCDMTFGESVVALDTDVYRV